MKLIENIQRDFLIRQLARSASYNPERITILETMTLNQLQAVYDIVEEMELQSTSSQKCRTCRKMNIGTILYEGFRWKLGDDQHLPPPFRLDFDSETEEIIIPEEMLMTFIEMVNPGQTKHRIRLVSLYAPDND